MKPKALKKKLSINKQTVSNLSADAQKVVVAGDESQCRIGSCPLTWDCPTDYTCNCPGTGETCDSCTTCGGRICDWSYYPNNPC